MCNAHNHPAWCTCGFGGEGHLGQNWGGGAYGYGSTPRNTWTGHSSLDAPNAFCPVCESLVFFVRPRNGGAVWFDELGPPWPKHACMDQATNREIHAEPLHTPTDHVAMEPRPGWRRHKGRLETAAWDEWACFEAFVDGEQIALPIAPPPSISPSFVSWRPSERMYGDLQFLIVAGEAAEVFTTPICSGRAMRRARSASGRRITDADRRILGDWIGALDEVDPATASGLLAAIDDLLEVMPEGWATSEKHARQVRRTTARIAPFPLGDHDRLYKWVRLFLS